MPFNHGFNGCFADLNTNKRMLMRYNMMGYNGIQSDITGILDKKDSDGITIHAIMGD
jgi:hypothetical protein